jgi:protoheme IX farnesyltransferase
VFSASVSFLIGSKEQGNINWKYWMILTLGGFLVTAAANGFNEIIEKDLDKLMDRTKDRPIPSGRMTTGKALVMSLFMGILGTLILVKLNFLTGLLSVFSILLYAFVYTPLKRKSPIAVFVGAIPGALPPLIGYFAAFENPHISWIPIILFLIQFVWQFPHFWAIAWVLYDDYLKAGFSLLPSKTGRSKHSAFQIMLYALALIPFSLVPWLLGWTGIYSLIIASVLGIGFFLYAYKLYHSLEVSDARKLMFASFVYLPIIQFVYVFDRTI